MLETDSDTPQPQAAKVVLGLLRNHAETLLPTTLPASNERALVRAAQAVRERAREDNFIGAW